MPATARIPDAFAGAAAAMPEPQRALLVDGADPSTVPAEEVMRTLGGGVAAACFATDVVTLPRLLCRSACEALAAAVDAEHDCIRDTVDGAPDCQLNLTCEELSALIGAAHVEAIAAVARALDLRGGGGRQRELAMVEAFVRKYTPATRPWHPFHQDRARITVNVALSDDSQHGGGRLLGLFADGVVRFDRAAGDATVHFSRVVHGVSRMEHGTRYALIVFLGEEPPVRRTLGPDGVWTRAVDV